MVYVVNTKIATQIFGVNFCPGPYHDQLCHPLIPAWKNAFIIIMIIFMTVCAHNDIYTDKRGNLFVG